MTIVNDPQEQDPNLSVILPHDDERVSVLGIDLGAYNELADVANGMVQDVVANNDQARVDRALQLLCILKDVQARVAVDGPAIKDLLTAYRRETRLVLLATQLGAAIGKSNSDPITKQQRDKVRSLKDSPIRDRIKALREARRAEAKRIASEELLAESIVIEEPYMPTAKQLRSMTYRLEGKTAEERNGAYLKQKISEIKNPGSDTMVFTDDESAILTKASLGITSPEDLAQLFASVKNLAVIQAKLAKLGYKGKESSLLRAILKCQELSDGSEDQTNIRSFGNDLQPFNEFVRRINEFVNNGPGIINGPVIEEGEFKSAEVVPIVPFAPERVTKTPGCTEIKEEDFTAEAMLKDIEKYLGVDHGLIIEKERMEQLIILHTQLASKFGEDNVKRVRTLCPNWSPLPWYGVEVKRPYGGLPVVVLEIPVAGNATYVVSSKENPWEDVVGQLNRTEAKALGYGIGYNHFESHPEHTATVFDGIVRHATI